MHEREILTIALNANKAFLAHHLFNEDGEGHVEILEGEKLDKAINKFQPFCSSNIQNLVTSFNAGIKSPGDNIFLESNNPCDYI
jgi:hypothetical protein